MNDENIERRAMNSTILELFKNMDMRLAEIQHDIADLKTGLAVYCNKVNGLTEWKQRHKVEHREDDKERISRGQAVLMLLLSTGFGMVVGILTMIIKDGMFS